jgi:methionine biosynthesis protein MetW
MIAGFLKSVHEGTSMLPARAPADVKASISARQDYAMMAEMVEPGSRVLDLGCGEGELLAWLKEKKGVSAQGVEIDPNKVRRAISRGVLAYQSDIEHGLADYPDGTFDFVILSQTLQEMRYPLKVLREMLRVGRHVIVAFPNFGHWTTRISHLLSGRSPRTELFPYDWYESPNLHFLTIYDFVLLCRAENWTIERQIFLRNDRQVTKMPNLLAEVGVFSIRRGS